MTSDRGVDQNLSKFVICGKKTKKARNKININKQQQKLSQEISILDKILEIFGNKHFVSLKITASCFPHRQN